jgi:hypothetical protein
MWKARAGEARPPLMLAGLSRLAGGRLLVSIWRRYVHDDGGSGGARVAISTDIGRVVAIDVKTMKE